jgi:hypothetical protein
MGKKNLNLFHKKLNSPMEQLATERDANKVEETTENIKTGAFEWRNEITHNTLLRYGTV